MSDPATGPVRAIGFIGLGRMGMPMATRLVEAGFEVRGFDVSPAAQEQLRTQGARPAATAGEAVAGADVVILMLPDSGVVEAVLRDAHAEAALAAGTTVVDMSSSEPERTRALARELVGRGVALVDAPVSGGVSRAVTGELAIMAGGEDRDVGRVEPVLSNLGRVYRSGPVGSGHAVKALNNLMSATHLLVTTEAILAGERFGLEPKTMLAIVNASSGRSGSTENKWPNFILPETYDSGFALRLMLKDMRIATDLVGQMQIAGRLGERAVELWTEAAEALPAEADHTEIARWLRERAGSTIA
jgi:3-hydroxyisobutyrate dehydrogenase